MGHTVADAVLPPPLPVHAQVIELPLKHPELFESLGIAQPKVRPGALPGALAVAALACHWRRTPHVLAPGAL